MQLLTRRILPISIAALLAGFYLWPAPTSSFADNYARVDESLRQSLLDFRAAHPAKTIAVDGRDWRYVSLGQSDPARETVLFLHGMTGAHDIWWRQLTALAPRYRVIAPDYPAADSLGAIEAGLLGILEREGVQEFHVVGSSLGGYVAQYLVARYPGRIRSAVFANTFPPNDIIARKNRTLGALLPFLPEWLIMRVLSQSIETKVYPASGNSELVRAFGLEQTRGRMTREQLLARFRCVIEYFEPPDPRTENIPVLIIEADNDPLVEALLRDQIKSVYAGAAVRNMSGAGHFPYLNQAEEYTRILLTFLENPPSIQTRSTSP